MSDEENDDWNRMRMRIFGEAGQTPPKVSAASGPVLEWSKQSVWGVWGRPGLAVKQRCLATVAILAAAGRIWQLEKHIMAALANGWTPEELAELMLHIAVYAGTPAAADGTAALERVLAADAGTKPFEKAE